MSYSGQPITLHNAAEVLEHVFYKSFTPSNTVKSFEAIDIFPINKNVF